MQDNQTFLQACLKKQEDTVPVWYMRQAGRYDPEYRKIKEKYSLLEICRQPELAARVTMMPVHKLGVDAAILFSDIMNPVESMGVDFDIVPNVGPVIDTPIRTTEDVKQLRPIDVERDLGHVLETIRILDKELNVPLIGFAGAPFTLASYLIEGKPSRNYIHTKQFMYGHPHVWQTFMDKLGDMVITYLKAQIKNGAQAVQLFDSWVGSLSAHDFKRYVRPTIIRIFNELSHVDVPTIYFPGVSSGELLPALHPLKANVISIDWRVTITEARKRLGEQFAIQGNLDPMVLNAPWSVIEEYSKDIIEQGIRQPGFIFNLGHGLFPEASLGTLQKLTAFVQEYSASLLSEIGERE